LLPGRLFTLFAFAGAQNQRFRELSGRSATVATQIANFKRADNLLKSSIKTENESR
jgi:uncharacterized membrane protein YoaK (UPF0700 family)